MSRVREAEFKAFDPSGFDPSGFDPGGFDPSGFDPSGDDTAYRLLGLFKTLREALEFYVQRDTNPEKYYPHANGR